MAAKAERLKVGTRKKAVNKSIPMLNVRPGIEVFHEISYGDAPFKTKMAGIRPTTEPTIVPAQAHIFFQFSCW